MRSIHSSWPVVLLGSVLILAGCGGSSSTDETAPSSPPVSQQRAPQGQTGPTDAAADPPRAPIEDVTVQVERIGPPGIDVVRRYTQMFYDGELDELQQHFSDEMKSEILPPEALAQLRERVREDFGEEVEVLGEDSQTKGGYRGFVRWARFSDHQDPIEVQWILREDDDTISGFFIRPVQRKQP